MVEAKEWPEVSTDELKEKSKTVGGSVPEDEVKESGTVAAAEVAEIEELDAGSFWALLIRAGYTTW